MTEYEESRTTKEDEDGSAGYLHFDVFLLLPKFLLLSSYRLMSGYISSANFALHGEMKIFVT